jgi:hypothetical protein
MNDLGQTSETISDPRALERAASLWEEYSYRHDMIWKLVFRITAVATALAIAPFLLNERAQQIVGCYLAFLPILAVLIVMLGLFALPSELTAFNRIKRMYQWEQDESFSGRSEWGKARFQVGFSLRIWVFLSLVGIGAAIYLYLFLVEWSIELTGAKCLTWVVSV